MSTSREDPASMTGDRGVLDRLILCAGVLLLLLTAVGLRTPVSTLLSARSITLDMSAARPNGGSAWVLDHELGVESDASGGLSEVRLFENETPLTPHAPHQAIRDGALGHFSHWGSNLYLSSTDGSDPTTNGRTYRVEIPVVLPAGLGEACLVAFLGAVVLTLGGVAFAIRRRRPLLTHAVPALCVLVGTVWWIAAATTDWAALWSVERVVLDLDRRGRPPMAQAATRPGNVTRLLEDPATSTSVRFVPIGEVERIDDVRRVALGAEHGLEVRDGLARLLPGGPGWTAELEPSARVGDIAEILLPIRSATAGSLIVEFFDRTAPTNSRIQLEVPVQPSSEVQALRIVRPLSFWVDNLALPLTRVRVSNPRSSDTPLTAQLDEVVLRGPAAAFQATDTGHDRLAIAHDLRSAVWQSRAGRFEVLLPRERGRLVKGAVAVVGQGPGGPVAYRLLLRRETGPELALHEGTWAPGEKWKPLRAELPDLAANDALILEVPALPAGSAFAWSGLRLVDTRRAPQRVLLLLLDTLRADALGSYGSDTPTPHLDALAARGVRFENAYSQAYWTRPSMPSIMTGRYVAATGVQSLGQTLPDAYTTLAEAFAEAGFLTVADIANTNAGPASGLDQGWDRLTLFDSAGSRSTSDQVVEHVLPLLPAVMEEDLLLYVHVMEAHGPYGPALPPEHQPVFPGAQALRPDHQLDREWATEPTDAGRRHWYAVDVANMDRGLGELFAGLDAAWGAELGGATVAVLSDHGEYLGEYGQWSHGWFKLLPEVTHVPLIVVSPSPALPARVERAFVENIDVAPTLLELVGASASSLGVIDGRSLVGLLRGEESDAHSVALTAVTENASEQMSLYAEGVALIGEQLTLSGRLDESARFTPAVRDPREAAGGLIDAVLTEHLHTRFSDAWSAYLDTRDAVRAEFWADVDTSTTSIDPAARQQLEELGYLGR